MSILALDIGSSHDLMVCGIKPCNGICAQSAEPAWKSLSLSVPPPLALLQTLSLKIKLKKKKKRNKIQTSEKDPKIVHLTFQPHSIYTSMSSHLAVPLYFYPLIMCTCSFRRHPLLSHCSCFALLSIPTLGYLTST